MSTYARLLLAFCLALPARGFSEDLISLKDGSSLRGTVRSISADGTIVVDSPLTSSPVHLRSKALRSINFEVREGGGRGHTELLHLVNGDILPGTLSALRDDELILQTWYAGEIRIPRRFAQAVDFGVTPQRLVLQGPSGASEWIKNEGWEFENGKMICATTGSIVRERILPKQFILRFRLEWENGPNFRIYFCDDHLKRSGLTDRYYFDFNSNGSQLRRETSVGEQRWFVLAQSHRRPEEFKSRGVDVEIRVDRQQRLLYLYLDGEKVQRCSDSIDEVPTGTGIMLQSLVGGELKNIIPRIEIYEWDAVTELRRDEGHQDPKTDGVVDVDGQHFSGCARALEKAEDKQWIIFDSPFNPAPLKIRTTRLSSLYFKSADDPPQGKVPIQFDLRGGGKLQLSSLALGEKSLTATHLLLGDLTLSREALDQLFVTDPEQ